MADAKKIAKIFSDEEKEKKIKIDNIKTIKMLDFKNILIGGTAAITCFRALSQMGPIALSYGGPVPLAISIGLSVFEMWSSKQIRMQGQRIAQKHSIKKHESVVETDLRRKNTEAAIMVGQISLYLLSIVNLIPPGPFVVPAIIFGATGIAAKLLQKFENPEMEISEKGKAR